MLIRVQWVIKVFKVIRVQQDKMHLKVSKVIKVFKVIRVLVVKMLIKVKKVLLVLLVKVRRVLVGRRVR